MLWYKPDRWPRQAVHDKIANARTPWAHDKNKYIHRYSQCHSQVQNKDCGSQIQRQRRAHDVLPSTTTTTQKEVAATEENAPTHRQRETTVRARALPASSWTRISHPTTLTNNHYPQWQFNFHHHHPNLGKNQVRSVNPIRSMVSKNSGTPPFPIHDTRSNPTNHTWCESTYVIPWLPGRYSNNRKPNRWPKPVCRVNYNITT